MIRFDDATMYYAGRAEPVLRGVDLAIDAGEFALVTGRTGAGKSTLLRAINGLFPHASGGTLSGRVTVKDVSTADAPPREFAHLVGMVGQDPLASFVSDAVDEELAYGMEQLGVEPQVMRRRIEETLDLLGIVELRTRALRTLSGGQQQRVAIGAVLGTHPPVLVLDEPTSALDPTAAEEVLATLARFVHDLGATVVLAEHRLERVLPFVDRVLHVTEDGRVIDGTPQEVVADLELVPPIVELGRIAGWDPLPLTVRDARAAQRRHPIARFGPSPRLGGGQAPQRAGDGRETALSARRLTVRHASTVAVRSVDLDLRVGEVVALMGRNGAGKSSLLWALRDPRIRASGTVTCSEAIALVPQTASDLLVADSVARECRGADARAGATPGACRLLLEQFVPNIDVDAHPRDLSAGGQLALALAIQLVRDARIVLLDEPTRGLDYAAKHALARILQRLTSSGSAVVVATHDVEFAAIVADRVVVLADGDVVAQGSAADVLGGSPAFAPQVSKILGADWLTIDDVRTAAGGAVT